ncbi:5-hydroxytryptamine receptor 3A-like [Pelobates cultripes]|uniref:5-hydroxytryptamine receptor 3A-like n=1 Tax=Pelobates cultripes TaxID=61616 RepID=A0AAD1THF3_PELCU|nr:5-hydroxytryptamine receptor 3A-like [Pelobates cultripes]
MNWTIPTIVYVDMYLHAIIHMDMSEQTVTSFIRFVMTWTNDFISWDPNQYCGIDKVMITGENLWEPDINVFETTETEDNVPVAAYYTLHYDGNITHEKPLRVVSTCNLDMFKFPFDKQLCNLTFVSFLYPEAEMVILPKSNASTVNKNSKSSFTNKGDWILQEISVNYSEMEYGSISYSFVVYGILIERFPLIFIINLIIPACFMIAVDVFSMFMSSYSERLKFKITGLLGFSVLLTILNDMLPNSDSPPILGIFCCVCMALMIFSIAGCVGNAYMMDLSLKEKHVPQWMKTLILHRLASILYMKPNAVESNQVTVVIENTDSHETNKEGIHEKMLNSLKKDSQKIKISLEAEILMKILTEIDNIRENSRKPRGPFNKESEWYFAALVVDRIIFIVYLILVITIFLIMIISWAQ